MKKNILKSYSSTIIISTFLILLLAGHFLFFPLSTVFYSFNLINCILLALAAVVFYLNVMKFKYETCLVYLSFSLSLFCSILISGMMSKVFLNSNVEVSFVQVYFCISFIQLFFGYYFLTEVNDKSIESGYKYFVIGGIIGFLIYMSAFLPVEAVVTEQDVSPVLKRLAYLILLIMISASFVILPLSVIKYIKQRSEKAALLLSFTIVSYIALVLFCVGLFSSFYILPAQIFISLSFFILLIIGGNSFIDKIGEASVNNEEMQKIINMKDIEFRKKIQVLEQLRQKNIESQESSRIKSELLANMSHELRTPMNSIIGFTSRVIKKCEDELPERQLNNLKRVMRNSYHLLSLINTILDVSKLEAGRMEVYAEEFDVASLFEEVTDMGQSLLQGKTVKLCYEVDGTLRIKTDKTKLKQILVNLMSNAIKFTEEGEVRLIAKECENIYISDDKERKEGIEFRVCDTGVGLKKEDIKYVFDDYKQIDGSLTRKTGGTGLGLALVKRFSTLLGGGVSVESEYGKGTTFLVKLPFDVTTIEKEDEDELPDVSQWIIVMHRMLKWTDEDISSWRESGFEVRVKNDADATFTESKSFHPRIVVLDVLDYNNQAIDVICKLKNNYYTKNCDIYSAGFSDKKNAYCFSVLGFDQKPVSKNMVVKILNAITLNNPDAEDILLVDNDESSLSLVSQYAEKEGDYSIRFCRNQRESEALCQKKKPDAMVINLSMPNLEAFKILSSLGSKKKLMGLPVYLIGSKMFEQSMAEFRNFGYPIYPDKSDFSVKEICKFLLSKAKGF